MFFELIGDRHDGMGHSQVMRLVSKREGKANLSDSSEGRQRSVRHVQ